MQVINIVTIQDLFAALADSQYREFKLKNRVGFVNGVQREDGSGRRFNVTMSLVSPLGKSETFFVSFA